MSPKAQRELLACALALVEALGAEDAEVMGLAGDVKLGQPVDCTRLWQLALERRRVCAELRLLATRAIEEIASGALVIGGGSKDA